MPIFAAKVLHGNARTLGVLMGATGIGALTGALVLATRTNVQGLGRWIAISCGAFGFCPDSVRAFAMVRAFRASARSGRMCHDDADGFVEHINSSDGAGQARAAAPWRFTR